MNSSRRTAFRSLPLSLPLSLLLFLPLLLPAAGCDEIADAVDEQLEEQAGCTAEQLGDLQEPDLPHCSRAIACCKFLEGECGEVRFFSPPAEIVQACQTNEQVLGKTLVEYRKIEEGSCPEYLEADACNDGAEQTRARYRAVVDEGQATAFGAQGAPSCRLIVEQTINRLDDELGEKARYLPEACEQME